MSTVEIIFREIRENNCELYLAQKSAKLEFNEL